MVAVITGDIMESRDGDVMNWLPALKNVLSHYGETPGQWEIYRGDSFQLVLRPELVIEAALHIKSVIKQTHLQDVRMGIGIGEETHRAARITESNGPAYINSGECFDALKKQTIAFKSNFPEQDKCMNVMLGLALLTANSWTQISAQAIATVIEHPQKKQNEIAALLGKSQSSVSEALKRGGFEEIMHMNHYFQQNFPLT